MKYSTVDVILGCINLHDPRNEGCSTKETKIRVEITEDDVLLFIGPRDWQWDRKTGKFIGCGTRMPDVPGEPKGKKRPAGKKPTGFGPARSDQKESH